MVSQSIVQQASRMSDPKPHAGADHSCRASLCIQRLTPPIMPSRRRCRRTSSRAIGTTPSGPPTKACGPVRAIWRQRRTRYHSYCSRAVSYCNCAASRCSCAVLCCSRASSSSLWSAPATCGTLSTTGSPSTTSTAGTDVAATASAGVVFILRCYPSAMQEPEQR